MIRLVASDMDGTLLDGKGQLSEDFGEILDKLNSMGIRFAAASGRQYYGLRQVFDDAGLTEKVILMSENGGYIRDKEKLIHSEPLRKADVMFLLEKLEAMPEVRLVLSGEETAYIKRGSIDHEFGFNADVYCKKLESVDSFYDVPCLDRIIKIAVFDNNAEKNIFPFLCGYKDRFTVLLSGQKWVDIVGSNVSKGSGLMHICNAYGIAQSEVMAFGDYLNDLSMIEFAGEGYAMENAHPDLKRAAKHIAPPNTEYGVCQVLRKLINGEIL